jgi:hypothetical protein
MLQRIGAAAVEGASVAEFLDWTPFTRPVDDVPRQMEKTRQDNRRNPKGQRP